MNTRLALTALALCSAALCNAHAACTSFTQPPFAPRDNVAVIGRYDLPKPVALDEGHCLAVHYDATVPGPDNSNSWHYEGHAQATPAAAHALVSSQRSGAVGDAGAPTTLYAAAHSILSFSIAGRAGAPGGVLVPLRFEVVGEGSMGSLYTHGAPGGASVALDARSSAVASVNIVSSYDDSEGTHHGRSAGSRFGPAVAVELALALEGLFEPGLNFFGIDLDVLSNGAAFADFAHTARITDISIADNRFELVLDRELFEPDPLRPGHYRPVAVAPPGGAVPGPASALLAVLALGLLARQRAQAAR